MWTGAGSLGWASLALAKLEIVTRSCLVVVVVVTFSVVAVVIVDAIVVRGMVGVYVPRSSFITLGFLSDLIMELEFSEKVLIVFVLRHKSDFESKRN
jgi:hypothetical protein